MATYKSLNSMKAKLLEKLQRRLQNNFPDYEFDEEFLGDYFDDACAIIKDWRKLKDDSVILSGIYDTNILKFIVESLNIAGLEGQSSSSANGITKSFYATPEANLKVLFRSLYRRVDMISKRDSKPILVKFAIGTSEEDSREKIYQDNWDLVYGLIRDPSGSLATNEYGQEEDFDRVITLNAGAKLDLLITILQS